jgi:hypothetical protein
MKTDMGHLRHALRIMSHQIDEMVVSLNSLQTSVNMMGRQIDEFQETSSNNRRQ